MFCKFTSTGGNEIFINLDEVNEILNFKYEHESKPTTKIIFSNDDSTRIKENMNEVKEKITEAMVIKYCTSNDPDVRREQFMGIEKMLGDKFE